MSCSFHLLVVLIVALAAVQSAVVRENNVDQMFRQGRTSTITKTVTTTAATPSTTVISTKLTCAILVNPVATTVCRRKKQIWGVPLFYPFGQNDMQQFDTFNPTQVLGVQPSVMPEFRNKQPSAFSDDSAISQFSYPFAIQPSIEGTADGSAPVQTMFRIADPFFFAPLSSLISNIVSSILTPPVTVTSTETVYTTTVTSSSFTATATYTLSAIACLPAQVNICPADPLTVAGAPLIAASAPAPLQAAAPLAAAPAPVDAAPAPAATAPVAAAPAPVATAPAPVAAAPVAAAPVPVAATPVAADAGPVAAAPVAAAPVAAASAA